MPGPRAPYTPPVNPGRGAIRGVGAAEPLAIAVLESKLGPVHVAAGPDGIHGVELRTTFEAFAASVARRTGRPTLRIADADPATRALVGRLEVELAEHLAGSGTAFTVPIVLEGISDWDRRVLEGVRRFRTAPPPRTARSPDGSAHRARPAPSAGRSAATRSAS